SKLAINLESLNEKLNLEPSIIAQHSSTLNNLNISDECDIEILRNISVHPELLKSAGISVDGQRSYSLADFVSLDEFTTLAEKGRDTY
ncbi:18751_t:CDS:2, partial [Racocetra fulgida]